jgi:SAM-dependent methyltransferase
MIRGDRLRSRFIECNRPMNISSGNAPGNFGPAGQSSHQALTRWYATPLGSHLLGLERNLVNGMLARRFGYHLLQLGCAELVLHDQSPMGHRFSFCDQVTSETCHSAIARSEAIPLGNESIDLVLLHHALDYSGGQHQLLREAARVLIAGGHLVIVGFNPMSVWGLRSLAGRRSRNAAPWHASMLGVHRLTDWLKLLDFQVEQIQYAAYSLPVNSQQMIRWSGWMEDTASRLKWPTGGIYAIAARKQVAPLTPVQGRRARLPVPGLIIPVADKVSRVARALPKACNEEQAGIKDPPKG